jgi:hypothetical protein
MVRRRLATALALGALAAFMVAGDAAAVIVPYLPNTSFEQPPPGCGALMPPLPLTTICGWNDLVGTMTQDTLHVTGSYSMKLTNVGTSVEATTTNGVCISPVSPGTHWATFWYLTSSPVVDVQFGAHWYPTADCTTSTFGNSALHAPTPITYGAWTQVSGTMTPAAPAGTGSAFFSFFASCQCSQQATITAYFDDVGFSGTSAVTVRSLTASRSPAGVRVRWRTGSEADTLGFHVYRERAGKPVRVDRRLIPARGSISGARYSFVDRHAPHAKLSYQLQAVGTDGSRTWYGRAGVPG